MTKTCFILDELYPADRGGIARLMHNIIHHAKSLDDTAEIHVVLARTAPEDSVLADAFAGIASLHYFRPETEAAKTLGLENLQVSAVFRKQADPFTRGLRVLDAVIDAADSCGGFDHIEIPDHMGLGSTVLQAKRAGFGFQNTEITCRIHSSLSAIISAEPFYHPRNGWLAPRLEMERFALQHADRVVAHLPTIASFNQAHFGFTPAWMDKVEIAFPPAIWPVPKSAAQPSPGKDFIFTARFQPFKRPALFIKAAVNMLETGTDYAGKFRLISYGFDRDYIDYLRLSIPARHHDRILIETGVPTEARLEAIQNGIIVQPSKFESLCALAYEVSTENRPLLLAKDCLAFGDDPHWIDGQNCLLFEPTPAALAATMEQARHWQPKSAVDITPDAAYFTAPPQLPKQPSPAQVGILVGPVQSEAEMAQLTERLAAFIKNDIPVHAFGDAAIVQGDLKIDYHQFTGGSFRGQQWRWMAKSLKCDAVILCTPDALPESSFVEQGARVVRPGAGYSSNSYDSNTGRLIVYPGKFSSMSIAEPRICPPCLLLHQQSLHLIAADDDHDLLPRLITRLAHSKLDLFLSPLPNVVETNHADRPPNQRHLGYEGPRPWRQNIRWIGVDVQPSTREGLLSSRPVILSVGGTPPLTCATDQPLTVKTGEACTFPLKPDTDIEGQIFTLMASHLGNDGEIIVSLHQASPEFSLAAHNKGHQTRRIKPGQSYQMRWGPIWRATPLTLVLSSASPAKIRFDNPIIISKR